jgi:hypothetical protein
MDAALRRVARLRCLHIERSTNTHRDLNADRNFTPEYA